jgi:hypothetical protein
MDDERWLITEGEPAQAALFAVACPRDVHRVAAHQRLRHDGTEVFVSEHLRWSRGRQPTAPRAARAVAPARPAIIPGQPSLFAPSPRPREPEREPPPADAPDAEQLPMW